jgi:dTMP kinase
MNKNTETTNKSSKNPGKAEMPIFSRQQFEILENFIVLEGLDGAGTSSQLQLLDKKLLDLAIPHACTFEPTDGHVGQQIRKILNKEVTVLPETMALLFTADRYEHVYAPVTGICDQVQAGRVVISDRYIFSSMAYQSIQCDFEWIYNLNTLFPLPRHLIFLNTPVDVCQNRLIKREHEELFDKLSFQEKVYNGYLRTLDVFQQTPMQIHKLDGTLSINEIFQQIWTILTALPIIKA